MSDSSQWHPLDVASAESPDDTATLLAVDLGLRVGLACFERDGRLRYARTRRFASRAKLKQAVPKLMKEAGSPQWLVLEGDPQLAQVWTSYAHKRGVQCLHVSPERWRQAMLLPRERRAGVDAKQAALRAAEQRMRRDGAPRHTPLRHDAAEAVLIGLWALSEIQWRDEPSPIVP